MKYTQYGFGDYQTFGSTSNHPNSPAFDADAMASQDDLHYSDIENELLTEAYEVQEEVGKDMAKSDPTWFGEIASIVCLTEQAEENEHDDVADTADTDTADAKENHNPQH